ncbi:MAG TPA: hypothetical protein DD658_10700, partial [Deltaproteobacteria bacterium]|nr:hypothetical protein [Deltaproteobacteria bacterium]
MHIVSPKCFRDFGRKSGTELEPSPPGEPEEGGRMRGWAGRDGRPLEHEEEESLFRAAFPADWEGMRGAARGARPGDTAMTGRWEAVLEIARRALSAPRSRPAPFSSAGDVHERYRYRLGDLRVEVFLVLLLDARHRLLGDFRASTGILNGSLVHPREVF